MLNSFEAHFRMGEYYLNVGVKKPRNAGLRFI